MQKPAKDYYTITELAQEWSELTSEEITIYDLLEYAANGKIQLGFWLGQHPVILDSRPCDDEFAAPLDQYLLTDFIGLPSEGARLLPLKKFVTIATFITRFKDDSGAVIKATSKGGIGARVTIGDLGCSRELKELFESEYLNIDSKTIMQFNESELASDQIPEELDIALIAWRAACTGIKQGEKPGVFIRDWLAKNYPALSDEARKRIAIVANWDKTPGAGKKSTGQ